MPIGVKNVNSIHKPRPRVITAEEAKALIDWVRVSLKQSEGERRKEEPGLTEDARNFIIKF